MTHNKMLFLACAFGAHASFLNKKVADIRHATCDPKVALVERGFSKITKLYVEENTVSREEPIDHKASYKYLGCYKLDNPDEQRVETTELSSMNIHKCFHLCQTEAAEQTENVAKFFMLRNGSECSCLHYIDKNPGASGEVRCNVPCTGDDTEICGGAENESVYVMLNCPVYPKSETEKLREEQMEKTMEKLKIEKK